MSQQIHWVAMGLHFGYPKCCIDSFIQLKHINTGPRQLDGSGYIPCDWCNEHKTTEQLINTINFNRDPSLGAFKYATNHHL